MLVRIIANVLLFGLVTQVVVFPKELLVKYLNLFLPRRVKRVKRGLGWGWPFQRGLSRITTEKSLWKARRGRELPSVCVFPAVKQSKNFYRKRCKDVTIR